MDCSPPGSSVHETSQARILEWVAISSSREFARPRDQTRVFCISCTGRCILHPEPPEKPRGFEYSPEVLSTLQGPSATVYFCQSPPNHGSLCVHSDFASLKNCVMLKKLHDPRLIMLPSFLPLERSSSAVPLQTSHSPSVTCKRI